MFDIDDLGPASVVTAAIEVRRAADAAEARLLALAAHWADLHPVVGQDSTDRVAVVGMEKLMPLAGEGTPKVAEFAPAELGAALGMSTAAAQKLVGDALELRHRLPLLWSRIHDGDVQAWRGRKVAEHTRCLPIEGAAWVDAQVAPFAHTIGYAALLRLIDAAILRFDPDRAEARRRDAAERRGVWLDEQMINGNREIRITTDALDAEAFDQTIDALADGLAALGDADVKDVRRAKAVGVIANPQAALDLLDPRTDPATGDSGVDSGVDSGGDSGRGAAGSNGGAASPAEATPAPLRGHRPLGKQLTLYLHLHADALTGAGTGAQPADAACVGNGDGLASQVGQVGRAEGLGPVTAELIREWLGRPDAKVTVKPVLDLADRASVDAYEVPTRMAETVLLRNPCCPFPWCVNTSRRKDLDHIQPYRPPDDAHPDRGGPPGQTTPSNLAPLCRKHHRLKTHGGWSYSMPEPGIYLWRSPLGRRYLVDHTGTRALSAA
ncbi:MAG TPA: DUF222 domain-containing protein [Nocardioidaceae bacterium]|nr:DUF222 domain-containing protein [Nocardioidaceae bacterium]